MKTICSRLAPLLRAAALALSAALAAAPATATLPPSLALDADAAQELRALESYLNGIRTVQARFQQTSSTGQTASGHVYMSRPGKLRVEYDPPLPVLVVADGTFLIYQDRAVDQVSYIPLGATPAGILLDDDISLDDPNLTVTDFTDAGDSLRLGVVRTNKDGEGSLTLVFDKAPLRLAKWEVTDAQGVTTRVSLADARFGVPLEADLFRFRDPRLPKEGEFPAERP